VQQTGAHIALDKAFFKSAISVVKINTYLMGRRLARLVKGSPGKGSIAFHPQKAGPWFNAWMAARYAGIAIKTKPEKAENLFVFDDSTVSQTGVILNGHDTARAINHRITDISKDHVAEVFESGFGYNLRIDPLTHKGPAVQKSNDNGTHDGIIVQCPLVPADIRPGSAYQKLVDSSFSGKTSEDFRVAYAFGEIPVIVLKHKELAKRFSMDYASVEIKETQDVFSPEEQNNIIAFCRKMGLDFGAIDILRDKHDGRIYIVDVNKTCMPVLSLTLKEQAESMRRISESFVKGLTKLNKGDSTIIHD